MVFNKYAIVFGIYDIIITLFYIKKIIKIFQFSLKKTPRVICKNFLCYFFIIVMIYYFISIINMRS